MLFRLHGRDCLRRVSLGEAPKTGMGNVPEGYRVGWGGQFDNLTRARKRLSMVLPVLNVPFSLVGGINLSVSAAVGFVRLFGVASSGRHWTVILRGKEKAKS